MKAAHWASRHARFILFLLVALVAGGIFASRSLPVTLFPHVNFPRIRVDFDAGDRPGERMAVEVTSPAEEALRAVPGVRTIQSISSRGSAEIDLTFDWGQDMGSALLQAEAEVNRILPDLPQGTSFIFRRMDPTVYPVISYSITSDTRPLTELHDIAQYQLRPILSTVPGVAQIGVDGGAVAEYRVTLDPARLQAHGLVLTDVADALSAANVLTAVGHVEENYRLYLVETDTQFKSMDEIGRTVLHSASGGVTLLRDIATIAQDRSPQFIHSTADGRDAVLVNVFQQPGGNVVEIAAAIRRAFAEQQKRLPPDVKIASWYDQSDLITSSAKSVRDSVLIGVGLAAIVLLLFLRNFRMSLIAIMAVPIVLAVTSLLLYLLNQSFNIMTLGGMAAAVGLIIDDAIVISEHIDRRLHGPGAFHADARNLVLGATEEFSKPLSGSSLSTIVIYIPPAFLVGVFGAFFAALSLSMASSLIVSFFVAWLAIPIVAARVLRKHDVDLEQEGLIARAAFGTYGAIMRPVLAFPWLILLLVIPFLWYGYFEYQRVASGFMPSIDEGGFVLDYQGPPGASITEMDRLLGNVEKILRQTPEVQAYSRRTGFSLGGDISETSNGDFFIRLKPLPRRSISAVMGEVSDRVKKTTPGLDIDPAQLMEDLIGDLTGKPQPVVVNLYCDDQKTLTDLAPQIADALTKGVPDLDDVATSVVPAGDSLDVQVDRVKASLEGVDPDALTRQLQALLTGAVTTQVQDGVKMVDVRVWIPKSYFNSSQDLGELNLRAPDGHLFPLKRVATFKIISGEPEITRDNFKRYVYVQARIRQSDHPPDLGTVVAEVKKFLDRPGMIPPGVSYTLGGQYEQQQIAFAGLIRVIVAAAALVFLLLLFLYERFRVAGAIMLTTVLAIAAVFIGLRWTDTELNICTLMGMVMIVGNVTEVSIFYYSEYADFLTDGTMIERLVAAGKYRMRAITMTTVAAILALLPLAIDLGQGTGMLQPLAVAIITGLVVQLPLVLIVLPALLRILRVRK
ncbi:MAG: efflux RND transporter permease subunit [Tepidisphaeraceae bacterium]